MYILYIFHCKSAFGGIKLIEIILGHCSSLKSLEIFMIAMYKTITLI